MKHGLCLVIKIKAQPVLASAWLAIGEGEEELRKKRERGKKKKAWPACDLVDEAT